MAQSYLGELLDLAARIMELDQVESQLDKREWKAAKAEYDAQKNAFNEVRGKYVDTLLESEGGREGAVADVEAEIAELRGKADPSWFPAISYTEENLLPYLRKQTGMNPKLRKATKLFPYIVAGIVIVAYFGVRLISATPITQPIETKAGIQQRAQAVQKAFRYDDYMDTRVRRGGWLKSIFLWPIEPTEEELQGAGEFVGLVLEGQKYAEGCGAVTGYGDSLSDAQIEMIEEVADYFERPTIQWEEPQIKTVLPDLESVSAC